MKRILSWTLVLIMTATMIPAVAFAGSVCDENGHNWSEWNVREIPNCVLHGFKERICMECGVDEQEKVPATGEHNWGEWECSGDHPCEPKTFYRHCEDCGEMETKTEPGPGHNWGDWRLMSAPTCVRKGHEERTCTRCYDGESRTIPATGEHKWGKWEYVEDIECTVQNTMIRECRECGESEKKKEQAPGHNWGSWEPYRDVTCKTDGKKERRCERCGKREYKIVPATGKCSWGGWELIDRATRTQAGTYLRTCEQCCDEQYKSIPRIAKPVWGKLDFTYDGKVHKPSLTIKDVKKNKLVKGTHYTVTIKNSAGKTVTNPKNVGKYKITVKFKGKYGGESIKKDLIIRPKATSITKLTKNGDEQFTVKWAKRKTQVTGYQIAYTSDEDFGYYNTVRIKNTSVTSKTVKKLLPKVTYYVKVRTYKMVNGKAVYSKWSSPKKIKVSGTIYYGESRVKLYHKTSKCSKIKSISLDMMTKSDIKRYKYKPCPKCY